MTEPLNVNTVIVGCGITGISTALHLLDNNYENFLVLEAQDYIGGRCQTYNFEKGFLEIGSEWLHGQKNNPLYDLALEYDLISDEDKRYDEKNKSLITSKHLFMTQYGEYISFNLAQKICYLLDKTFEMAAEYKPKSDIKTDRLVGEFLHENFFELCQKEFNLRFKNNDTDESNRTSIKQFCNDYNVECTLKDLTSLLNAFFIWKCKVENINKACHNIYNMSLHDFSSHSYLPGKQMIHLKKGFNSLFDALISKHRDEFFSKVLLKHSVEKILLCENLSDNNKESKECNHCEYDTDKTKIILEINADSSSKKKIIKCEHVLLTPSLGYLKANLDKLIQPNRYITKEKKEAVDRIGFGNLIKIFLIYDKPFWDSSFDGLKLIWVPNYEVTNKNLESLQHDLNKKSVWYHSITSIDTVKSQENVLCTYVANTEGLNDLSDEEIAKQLTSLLRQFLGTSSIPFPKLFIKCDWSKNDYIKGAKCYLSLDSKPSYFDTLEKPIIFNNKPYVLFGGEATSSDSFATVHSAFLSGCKESQRILNSLK